MGDEWARERLTAAPTPTRSVAAVPPIPRSQIPLGQLVEQPRDVVLGVRVMRQVPPAEQFLLDVMEAFGVGHIVALPDVR
jgi:hypothetical protein